MATTKNFIIEQGKTFSHVIRWERTPYIYKAITNITNAAPAVITSTQHGIPDGWKVAILSVKGMTQINALNNPAKSSDFVRATKLTADTIELNTVNSTDYGTYTSGGFIQYATPVSLTGFTARMTIKDSIGGTELISMTTENGGIVIDPALYTITLVITATQSAALTFTKGVYDLELVNNVGFVTGLLTGKVTLTKEITT